MNSWLLSIRWHDFAATARATDTAWASASAVSASAAGASLRHSSRSNDGSERMGNPDGNAPTVGTNATPADASP